MNLEWVPDFQVTSKQDFNPVCSRDVYFNVHKEFDACCGGFVVLQVYLDGFSFDQDGIAVGHKDSAVLIKIPLSAAPSVNYAYTCQYGGKRRYGQDVEQADKDELAISFLSNVITQYT